MKIPMSDRLLAVCSFIRKGDRVADIGCDHGYLGIYLLTNGIAAHMIESRTGIPALGIATTGIAGILMIVMIPILILISWIMWKAGIVKVVPND